MPIKLVGRKVCHAQHQHRIKQSKKSRHKHQKIHPISEYLLSWEIYVTNFIENDISNDIIKKLSIKVGNRNVLQKLEEQPQGK